MNRLIISGMVFFTPIIVILCLHHHSTEMNSIVADSVVPTQERKMASLPKPMIEKFSVTSEKSELPSTIKEYTVRIQSLTLELSQASSDSEKEMALAKLLHMAPTTQWIRDHQRNHFHQTPPEMPLYGRVIGTIEDELVANKLTSLQADHFYESCHQNNDIVTPVRALCAAKIFDHEVQRSGSMDESQVDESLRSLARSLMLQHP